MYKAQIICFIIVAFVGAFHFFSGSKKDKSYHWFSALILATLTQLCLDITTNYTVNHLEEVSPVVNRLAHNFFLSFLIIIFFMTYKYLRMMIKEEFGTTVTKFKGSCIPMVMAIVGVFVLPLYYMKTPHGNYSYGPAATMVYLGVAVYVIFIVKNLFKYRKQLPRKKQRAIMIALVSELVVSAYQAVFPTSLISCLGVTLVSLGIYLTVENPDALLVDLLKKETHRADVANQAKTDFLANMSHEIRTPINAVLGMNEMILRESSEPLIRDYARDVQGAAKSLLSIINDVLDITKVEAGKLEILPVEYDFSSMLYDVINMIYFKAKGKELEFQVDIDEQIPGKLFGDDIRIRQILVNILNNAVKYTHKGSVTLKVELLPCRQEDVAEIKFHVIDTGIGIKEEDLGKLYTPFARIEEKRNRNIEGAGLGMSITTQLLYMLGSELKVKSKYGEGSEFSFVLKQKIRNPEPIGKIEQRITEIQVESTYHTKYQAPNARILVVDDNEMNRRVFCNLLKETQMKIDEADCGSVCLAKVKKHTYDIIFMDHMMPEMDGIETFRAMNLMDDSLCKDTPVVILTANAIVGAREQYLQEGFRGYISKPIDFEKLEATIKELLRPELLQYVSGESKKQQCQAAKKQQLSIIDGLDWCYAKTHFNNEEAMLDALKFFAVSLEYHAKELEKFFANIHQETERKEYCTQVHAMKSMAASVGIIPLSGMAKVLEDASKNNDQQLLHQLTPVFLKHWRKYKEHLQEFLPEAQAERKNAEDHKEEVEELLQNIKTAAEDMDIDGLDALAAELEKYAFEPGQQEKVEAIKKAIMNFDIEYLLTI